MRTASDLQVVVRVADLRAAVAAARSTGATVGFVPTMGALHDGHLSLIERARQLCSFVIVSTFVNPLQFGPAEDFQRYPRDPRGDEAKAARGGADLLFSPSVNEMYPADRAVTVAPGPVGDAWEGTVRPGHFAGVLTAVATLFHIVGPDVAVFGQKDFQQATLITAMVRDLRFPVDIVIAPTVRDADGLALSSRNAFLAGADRARATLLIAALRAVEAAFRSGETLVPPLHRVGTEILAQDGAVVLDYLAFVAPGSLTAVTHAEPGTVVLIAARIGATRLIDNIVLTR
ncbi:MAG: pantoate--beta-alanine ligase [Gemmatimonadaceae bacterium]